MTRNRIMQKSALLVAAIAALAVLGAASPAFAHPGHGDGLAAGLTHPFTGIDHLLAMVAVGLWASQIGRPALWVLPVVFPALMAVGAAVGIFGMPMPWVEVGIVASVIALGALVAFGIKASLPVSAALVGLFALFHGYAHGTEMPVDASGALYAIGFVASTAVLHGIGLALGLSLKRPVLLRTAGGTIAALGLILVVV